MLPELSPFYRGLTIIFVLTCDSDSIISLVTDAQPTLYILTQVWNFIRFFFPTIDKKTITEKRKQAQISSEKNYVNLHANRFQIF